MDISPYLRKPLRSLQEVEEALKPASAPETVPAEPERAMGDPLDPSKT